MNFVTYMKPLDAQTVKAKIESEIEEARVKLCIYNLILPVLIAYNGKQISKRLLPKVQAVLPESYRASMNQRFGSSHELNIYSKMEKILGIDLKDNDSRFDYEATISAKGINGYYINLPTKIQEQIDSLAYVEELTQKYNTILQTAKDLDEQAEEVNLKYIFDIAANSSK